MSWIAGCRYWLLPLWRPVKSVLAFKGKSVLKSQKWLEMNPAAEYEGKRAHCDEEPEKDTLKKRSNAHFAESLHGKPGPNQVERDGQAGNAKMLQHRIRGLEDRNVGVGDCREAEKENEPWPLNARLALVSHRGSN